MSNDPGNVRILHQPEAGIPDLHFDATAHNYAKHLARYVTCASTISSYVRANYGVSIARAAIERMQVQYRANRTRFTEAAELLGTNDSDALDFRVKGLAKRVRPDGVPTLEADEPAPRPIPARITSELIEAIAQDFGLTAADILGDSRKKDVMIARKCVAFTLVSRGNSHSWTGRRMNRDHSTVLNLVDRFKAEATPEMRAIAARYIGAVA